jgi:RNA polymerase sigma factor (sigma-70 family)
MATKALETVVQHLRSVTERPDDVSDADLLERFLRQRDEAAFAALMRRNGAMVLAVCRRLAGNLQDAEDAFQATFLLLARRAGAIRRKESLAAWLHSVARRTAQKARRAMLRRQQRERRAARPASPSGAQPACGELDAELDRALLGLPEKYRNALLLCYFQGRTVDEAARELGCPRGTVASRLAQGRVLLRRWLARRGLVLSEAALVTALLSGTSSAAVPAGLARATLKAAAGFAGGSVARALVSPSVAALVAAGLRAAILSKLKTATVLLLLFAGVAAGVSGTLETCSPETNKPPVSSPPRPREIPAAPGAFVSGSFFDAEDPLPPSAIARIGTLRFRHPDHVKSVTFSPDGGVLVSQAGDDVRFWNITTGEEMRRLGNLRYINACALSPDGKTLALVRAPDGLANNMILGLWDAASGKLRRTLSKGQVYLSWAQFSPDGNTLLTNGPNGTVELWDLGTGKARILDVPDGVQMAIFNAAGTHVITTGRDQTIRFRDVITGKETRRLHTGATVGRIAVSPDDRWLATVSSQWKILDQNKHGGSMVEEIEPFLRLWNVSSGKEVRRLATRAGQNKGLRQGTEFFLFAPDSKTLFSNGPGPALRAWDVATGKEVRTMPLDCYAAWGLALSRDGKRLATAAGGLTLRLFDANTGKDLAPPGDHQLSAGKLLLSPDSRNLIAQTEKNIEVWDPKQARLRRRFEAAWDRVNDFCLDDGGTRLFTVGTESDMRILDITGATPDRTIPVGPSSSRQMAVTPDGKHFALAAGKSVRVFETQTGREMAELKGHEPFVAWLYFIEQGKKLVVCSVDYQCHLWYPASARKLKQFELIRRDAKEPSFASYFTAISPDQRIIAVGTQNRTLSLWELATGRELATFTNLPDGLCPLAFSPDGRMIAWGGWNDCPVYLTETASGKERRRLLGHKGRIVSLAYSADGKTLVSGSLDTTILVWNVGPRNGVRAPLTSVEVDRCWQKLAGADAAEAYDAIRKLAADPDRAVPLLDKHLRAVPHVAEEHLDRLIAQLDSKEFAARQQAIRELEDLGEIATASCEKALKKGLPIEVQRRLARVLAVHKERRQNPPAEVLRSLRALEVLEAPATPTARKVLTRISQGAPASRITLDARASLERLTK